jgi:hypothetical protein
MSSDKLLDAVARAAEKDEIEDDPRWRALVEGRLSEADRKALEELAEEDARHEEALVLLEPLGDEAKARITDRILGELGAAPRAEDPPAPRAEVIALPARRRWAPVVAALALAAGVALFVMLRESPTEVALGDPIPRYEIALVGGELATRADPGAPAEAIPVVLGPGSSLEIVLRPATPYREPIAARGFLIQNGRAQAWEIKPDISPDGAVRIAGERETLFANVAPGPWEIAIAVGPSGALPDAEAVGRGVSGEQAARIQMLRRAIVLVEPQKVAPSPVPTPPRVQMVESSAKTASPRPPKPAPPRSTAAISTLPPKKPTLPPKEQ